MYVFITLIFYSNQKELYPFRPFILTSYVIQQSIIPQLVSFKCFADKKARHVNLINIV